MKRISALSVILALTSYPVTAGFGNPGFSGEISLFGGYSSSESNFNTDEPTKTGELNSGGKSDSDTAFFPLGQLRYSFGPGAIHQVFIGTSRSDIVQGLFAVEFGYKLAVIPNSTIAISWLPTVMESDTWADPFVTDIEREETEESGNAFRIQVENIVNTGISADIAYYDKEIEDELSGTTDSDFGAHSDELDRNGDGLYGKVSWSLMPDRATILQPSIRMNKFTAEGDALSNTRYGAGLTLIRRARQHVFALTGDYVYANFNKQNPIFEKTQSNSEIGVTFAYEYANLLGMHNLAFNALVAYNNVDSNIDFYDEVSLFSGLGVTYKF